MKETRLMWSPRAITLVLALTCITLPILTGCQQEPLSGETYRKEASAWPLFGFQNSKGVNEDGSTWEKEKGDAFAGLQTWDRQATYDKDGYVISRTEKSGFFPISSDEIEETREYRIHKGTVLLLFPFYSKRAKNVESK